MKYAVIQIKGTQYKVQEGDEILVSYLADEKPEANVLLYSNDGKVKVGKPYVTGVKIKLKVVSELEKGEKVSVVKFKSKSRYRKRTGFRSKNTRLLVEKIS